MFGACLLDLPAQQRVRPLHWCYRTQDEVILRQVQQTHEMGVNAAQRWETSFEVRRKPKTNIKNGDNGWARRDPLRDLLEWLEEFADDLVEEEASVRSGTSGKQLGIGTAQHFYALSEGPKLRSMQKDQHYKGSLQIAHRTSSSSRRKVW